MVRNPAEPKNKDRNMKRRTVFLLVFFVLMLPLLWAGGASDTTTTSGLNLPDDIFAENIASLEEEVFKGKTVGEDWRKRFYDTLGELWAEDGGKYDFNALKFISPFLKEEELPENPELAAAVLLEGIRQADLALRRGEPVFKIGFEIKQAWKQAIQEKSDLNMSVLNKSTEKMNEMKKKMRDKKADRSVKNRQTERGVPGKGQ